jgi:hypothetical protein
LVVVCFSTVKSSEMSHTPYIPISQYLQPSDVNNKSIPIENRFHFCIDHHHYFFVYKSLACFFSPKVSLILAKNHDQFQIQIENIQYDPKLVKNSLISFLSGSSLNIDKSNFTLFQKVFDSLGNTDFTLFFGSQAPKFPTEFFLSMNSLKNIPKSNIEKDIFNPLMLNDFTIPIGLVHLFWKYLIKVNNNLFSKYDQNQILNFTKIFTQLKKGIYVQLTQDQKKFFQSLSIHKTLLNNLSSPLSRGVFSPRRSGSPSPRCNGLAFPSFSGSSSPRRSRPPSPRHRSPFLPHLNFPPSSNEIDPLSPINFDQTSPLDMMTSSPSSSQNILPNESSILNLDSARMDHSPSKEKNKNEDLLSLNLVQSHLDQKSEIEEMKQNVQELDKLNKGYISKIALLEFEIKQFKNAHNLQFIILNSKLRKNFKKL